MESFNDLGQMYFSAVDSRDISLAAELLARVISKVNEDDRILNLFFKLINYLLKIVYKLFI